MKNVEKTVSFLENTFRNSEYFILRPDQLQYRLNHTYRVANIGKQIAVNENLDIEAVIVGCLLHDISYSEEMKSDLDWRNHGRRSAEISRNFVQSLDFSETIKNQILYGIAIHVDDESNFKGERSILAETIGEADNIDRFDKYRLYESLIQMEIQNLSLQEQIKVVNDKIVRLEKLRIIQHKSNTSDQMWKSKIDYQLEYFKGLLKQLHNSDTIL